MSELLQSALPHLDELKDSDLRSLIRPSNVEAFAVEMLWALLESHLCLSKPASEVGISKGIMLLTRGRIGPAFDSTVRKAFKIPRIMDAGQLLKVYAAVAQDLHRFEHSNRITLEGLLPQGWAPVAVGRIVDMVAGPRENPEEGQRWFEQRVAELKAELEKLPADRQEQLRQELEEESEE